MRGRSLSQQETSRSTCRTPTAASSGIRAGCGSHPFPGETLMFHARNPVTAVTFWKRCARLVRAFAAIAVIGSQSSVGTASAMPPAATAPGGPGTLSYFDLARKDCVGTVPHHDLEGLVHGGRWSPERRLVPDHRQHQRQVAPVHRDRRPHLHRPPGARHDLDGHGPRRERDGVPGHQHGQERRVQARHRLHHRPGPEHRAHEHQADAAAGGEVPGVRAVRRDRERQRRGRRGQRWRRQRRHRHLHGSPDRRLLRHEHHHQRGQPRLRPAGVRRPRRAVLARDERVRGYGQ